MRWTRETHTWNCNLSVPLIKFNRWRGMKIMVIHYWSKTSIVCSIIFAEKFPPTLSHVTMRDQEMREDDWRSWVHMCCDQSLSGSWESNFCCHLMEEESTEYSETRLKQSEPFKGSFLCSISFEIFIHLLQSICSREKDYDWRYSLVTIGWFFWVFNEKSFFPIFLLFSSIFNYIFINIKYNHLYFQLKFNNFLNKYLR